MDLKKYKELYKGISNIVNNIDPSYYNGPPDEYDFQVKGIIKLIENDAIDNYDEFLNLFFGGRKDIIKEEEENIKKIMKQVKDLTNKTV